MKIDRDFFKIEYTRGTGPGGQNKNKVETCVVITHIPTGFKEKCEDSRKRNQNEKTAHLRLLSRLKKVEENEKHEKLNDARKQAIEENGTIRTYNFKGNYVKEHRTGKTANLNKVMDGNLNLLK